MGFLYNATHRVSNHAPWATLSIESATVDVGDFLADTGPPMSPTLKRRRKAQIWILRGSQVLILRTRPDRGDFWQPVTGHVEEGETFEAGARREAFEETGIPLGSPITRLGAFEFDDRWGYRCSEEVFAMEAPLDFEVKLEPSEHVALEWRPLEIDSLLEKVAYPPPAEARANLLKLFQEREKTHGRN